MRTRSLSLGLFAIGFAAALTSKPATAQLGPMLKWPAELELTRGLGFRTGPSLDASFVLPHPNNYLQPPTHVKVQSVVGTFGQANAFCLVEAMGKQGYINCGDATALKLVTGGPSTTSAPSTTTAPATTAPASTKPAIVTKTASGGVRCAPDFQYTNYKQYTGPWEGQPVHKGYMTFKETACHMTAWSSALGYYGQVFDPPGLRDKLDAMDGWQHVKVHPTASALETLTHGSKYVRLKGKTPEMMEVVRKHFCDDKRGEPMLGSVDYEKDRDTNADHWVTVIGFQDGDAIVLDPGSGDHKGTRISGATLPPNAKVPTGVLLGDIKSGAGGRYFLVGLEFVNP